MCVSLPAVRYAEDGTPGFVHARQVIHQLSFMLSLPMLFQNQNRLSPACHEDILHITENIRVFRGVFNSMSSTSAGWVENP